MVRTVVEALALREARIGQFCMGEVHGRAPDSFDFGNSPFEISGVDFHGKTIIQRTSAGTQGIVAAANQADREGRRNLRRLRVMSRSISKPARPRHRASA